MVLDSMESREPGRLVTVRVFLYPMKKAILGKFFFRKLPGSIFKLFASFPKNRPISVSFLTRRGLILRFKMAVWIFLLGLKPFSLLGFASFRPLFSDLQGGKSYIRCVRGVNGQTGG